MGKKMRVWVPFSACSPRISTTLMGLVPNPIPSEYERFLQAIPPTPDEVAMMLADLRRVFGKVGRVSRVLGLPARHLFEMSSNAGRPSRASARLIWIVWSLVCRPGELTTVFDLETCGRFTRRGNPATAGKRLKKNLRRYHGKQDE